MVKAKRRVTCSLCGLKGHNSRTCTESQEAKIFQSSSIKDGTHSFVKKDHPDQQDIQLSQNSEATESEKMENDKTKELWRQEDNLGYGVIQGVWSERDFSNHSEKTMKRETENISQRYDTAAQQFSEGESLGVGQVRRAAGEDSESCIPNQEGCRISGNETQNYVSSIQTQAAPFSGEENVEFGRIRGAFSEKSGDGCKPGGVLGTGNETHHTSSLQIQEQPSSSGRNFGVGMIRMGETSDSLKSIEGAVKKEGHSELMEQQCSGWEQREFGVIQAAAGTDLSKIIETAVKTEPNSESDVDRESEQFVLIQGAESCDVKITQKYVQEAMETEGNSEIHDHLSFERGHVGFGLIRGAENADATQIRDQGVKIDFEEGHPQGFGVTRGAENADTMQGDQAIGGGSGFQEIASFNEGNLLFGVVQCAEGENQLQTEQNGSKGTVEDQNDFGNTWEIANTNEIGNITLKSKVGPKTYLFQCRHCEKAFDFFPHFRVHERTHVAKNKPPFICKHCDRVFKQKYYYEYHEANRLCQNYHTCESCNRMFKSATNFIRHAQSRICKEPGYMAKKPKPIHLCNFCNTPYERKRNRDRHERICFKRPQKGDQNGKKGTVPETSATTSNATEEKGGGKHRPRILQRRPKNVTVANVSMVSEEQDSGKTMPRILRSKLKNAT